MTTTEHDDDRPSSAADGPQAPRGTTFETLAVVGFIFGLFAIVASVFAVVLAAQGADGGGSAGGGGELAEPSGVSTLDVTLKDFAFDPDDLRVDAGAVLNLTNEGSVVHNLAVDGTASDMIEAGEGGTLDLAEVEPGTYTIICEVPGHEAAGMRGTLVIE